MESYKFNFCLMKKSEQKPVSTSKFRVHLHRPKRNEKSSLGSNQWSPWTSHLGSSVWTPRSSTYIKWPLKGRRAKGIVRNKNHDAVTQASEGKATSDDRREREI